jgi:SAM-dependent methyltransferase
MTTFKNSEASHQHSLRTLDSLYEYDDFMDSLRVVADMGCGSGLDIEWWATRETRDDPPEPHNYICYAVDINPSIVEDRISNISNLRVMTGDFEQKIVPRSIDMLWCHDAFQYVKYPLQTLKLWNECMNPDGMMIITVPQMQSYQYNRVVTRSVSGCFYHYNACNLIYMLAVNGFDCRDSYVLKEANDPWLSIAVYKSNVAPMDPATTSWFDLASAGLLNDSVLESLNRYGHVRQEELLFKWFDKDFYFVKD